MMAEPTPEMIAMARRICASVCGGDAVGRVAAREFLRGDADDESDMRIALAAIIETQRSDAELAEAFATYGNRVPERVAAAIRSGAQLKGQDHG